VINNVSIIHLSDKNARGKCKISGNLSFVWKTACLSGESAVAYKGKTENERL
jgi:hypothetical protein